MAKFPNFPERYPNLINHRVPRQFLHSPSSFDCGSDIPEMPTGLNPDLPAPPPGGFIDTYCRDHEISP